MDDFMEGQEDYQDTGVRSFSEAWIKYVLEFPLNIENADEEKRAIIKMLKPVIDTAARSNLKRGDVRLFLWGYDNVWKSYFVYKRKGKYDPDLIVLKRSLREGFALMLYRSIDMGQMRMIFEPKRSIFQHFLDSTQRKLSIFKRKEEPAKEVE